jgi:hypothetical protein
MIKIGFSGQQNSGKTYLTNMMVITLGYTQSEYEILKLAEPVYKISDYIYYILGKDKVKNRRLLQFIGTEIGRELFDKDIWINVLLDKINESDKDVIFVDDIRFKNELKKLRENGFLVYRVVPKRQKNIKKSFIFHKSELNILKYYEIVDRIRTFLGFKTKYFDKIIYNKWSNI